MTAVSRIVEDIVEPFGSPSLLACYPEQRHQERRLLGSGAVSTMRGTSTVACTTKRGMRRFRGALTEAMGQCPPMGTPDGSQ
jgi:hypothetical protein